MFWRNEAEKVEFFLVFSAVMWIMVISLLYPLLSPGREVGSNEDQYFWFTLQNPGGGSLSYPFLAIGLLKFLHILSGENIALFAHLSAIACLVAFLSTFAVFLRMGIPPQRLLLLSLIFQPQFQTILLRLDIFAIALSLLAVWLFYSGKRMEGWLALLGGIFFKVLPVFFAPLFLAMELKDFNRNSAARVAIFAAISLLAFFAFPDNISTAIFNSARGIQLESVYSNILLIANAALNLGIHPELNYGGYHLILPESLSFLPTLALFLQGLAALAVSALFWREGAKKERLFLYALLVSFAMVIPSKILSNQFIFWPLFFAIPVLAFWKDGKGKHTSFIVSALFLLLSLATFVVYPLSWNALVNMEPWAILSLTVRDLVLVCLFLWLLKHRKEIPLSRLPAY